MNSSRTFSLWRETRDTLTLALPLIMALLSQVAMELVDTLMMGRLGPHALAAGGLGSAVFITLFVLFLGVIIAVGTCVAHAYGAGRHYEVSHIARQGLWLALFLSIPSLVLLWFAPDFLLLIGQSPEVIAHTTGYLHGLMWAFLPALGFLALREFIAAVGKPQIIMVITALAIPINVVCNYILMYGKLGFPALGVAGIGWATSFVQLLMFIALAYYVNRYRHFRRYALFRFLEWPNAKKIFEIVKIGWPIGVTLLFEVGLFSVTAMLMGHLGTIQLAAHQIALQCASIVYMIPLGIAQATTMRVGHAMGTKNIHKAKFVANLSIGIGLIFALITGLCFWLLPDKIVNLYLDIRAPENAIVVGYAALFLKIAAVFQLVDVVQGITNGALRGLKDTFIPMLLGLVSYWGSGLASGYFLAFTLNLGGVGLWWGLAIGIGVSAIFLYGRFYWQVKQKIKWL